MAIQDKRRAAAGRAFLPFHERSQADCLAALTAIYEAGGRLQFANEDKTLKGTIYAYRKDGTRVIRPRLQLGQILAWWKADLPLLLYGAGDLGVGIVDLDPATAASVEAIVEQAGEPLEAWLSSGSEKPDRLTGGTAYGGHLAYRITRPDNRATIGDQYGNHLGDLRAGSVTDANVSLGVVVYDPVGFVKVMEMDDAEAIDLSVIRGGQVSRSGGGGGGGAEGIHPATNRAVWRLAARDDLSDVEFKALLDEILDEHSKAVEKRESGESGRVRALPKEVQQFRDQATAQRKLRREAKKPKGMVAQANAFAENNRRWAEKRAGFNLDQQADPLLQTHAEDFLTPQAIATLNSFRSDYLRSAIRRETIKGTLTDKRKAEYLHACIDNGMIPEFGERAVANEIEAAVTGAQEWLDDRRRERKTIDKATGATPLIGRKRKAARL